MIYTPLTKKALKISFEAHKNQLDKSGLPYFHHPFHLAEQMDDPYEVCVALLHDVVEDTPLTFDDLRNEGIPEIVIEALELMTHSEGVPYQDYVYRLKFNPLAKRVKLADQKGFNLHNDYKSQDNGLDGAGYLAAQKIWKQSKDGGQPIIAVFVADISGSMAGIPINSLKESLLSTSSYIKSDNYIGLVSYSDTVHINLPIDKFDDEQRAYFSGAVKSLDIEGSTATYDAVLVALKMMLDKKEEIPNAKLMLFVLSDGDQNRGYKLDRVAPIVGGLKVPVYTIGYNLESGSQAEKELKRLSGLNEASLINASSGDLINHMRNLFNVEL